MDLHQSLSKRKKILIGTAIVAIVAIVALAVIGIQCKACTSDMAGTPPDVTDFSVVFIDGKATLLWTDSSDPSLDHVEISWGPDGKVVDVAKGVGKYVIPDFKEGIEYNFTVKAADGRGNKSEGISSGTGMAYKVQRPATAAPSEIIGIDGTPVTGQVTLSWTNLDASEYDYIEIAFDPDQKETIRIPKEAESRTLTGLINGDEHTFFVAAVDAQGNRKPLEGLGIFIPSNVSPNTVGSQMTNAGRQETENNAQLLHRSTLAGGEQGTLVSGRPVAGRITLDWTNSAFAGDSIEIVTNPDGNATSMIFAKNSGTHTFIGLSDNDEYSFMVYGIDQSGKRTVDNIVLSTPPPSSVIATPFLRAATLVWEDPDDPNLDHIELSYSPGGSKTVSIAKGAEINTITGLSENTEYLFQVTAVTSSGTRYAVNAKTAAPELPIVYGTSANGEITVEWTDPAGIIVDHIEIVCAADGEREQTRLATRGMGKREFTGLRNDQEYAFVVYAVDNEGKLHPVESARIQVARAVAQPDAPVMLITDDLIPLKWNHTDETTFDSSTIYALAFGYTADGNPRWVAGGADGKLAYSSDNGINWEQVSNSHFGSFSVNAICYANNRWVAGGKGGRMAWSANAITWNAINQPYFVNNDQNINAINYGNGRWIAGGTNGAIIISDDNGHTWHTADTGAFEQMEINTIAIGPDRWVAGAMGGKIAYSDDKGSTWTSVYNSTFGNYAVNVIIYDQYRWLAGGYAQRMAWSSNGIMWNPQSRPFYILCMAFNGSRTVAGGQEGRMSWTGTQSIDWVSDSVGRSHFQENWVQSIAFGKTPHGKGRWLAGGQNGRIIFADENE